MLPEDDFGKVFARYEKEPKYDSMIIMLNSLLGKENYYEVRKTEGKEKLNAFQYFVTFLTERPHRLLWAPPGICGAIQC